MNSTLHNLVERALQKALNTTKLVLVQRVRHDKSGDHITKKWVTPDKVKKTDAVLEHGHMLEKDHPALKNKPKPTGTVSGKKKPAVKKPAPAKTVQKKPVSKPKQKQAPVQQPKPQQKQTPKPAAQPKKKSEMTAAELLGVVRKTVGAGPGETFKDASVFVKVIMAIRKMKASGEISAAMDGQLKQMVLHPETMPEADAQQQEPATEEMFAKVCEKIGAGPDAKFSDDAVYYAAVHAVDQMESSGEISGEMAFDLKDKLWELSGKEAMLSGDGGDDDWALDFDLPDLPDLPDSGPEEEPAPQPEVSAEEEGKTPAGPDTYAKKEPQKPKVKPPIVRSDIDALGASELSADKIAKTLESVRADGDSSALSDKVAENAREQAYVSLLNTISDPETLKTIVYTGVVPEDPQAQKFVETKLYQHYREIREAPPDYDKPESKYTTQTARKGIVHRIAQAVEPYFPEVGMGTIESALETGNLTGPEYVFRMTYPAESTMILGSAKQGNRQIPANAESMPYKPMYENMTATAPEALVHAGRWFAQKGQSDAEGIGALLDHVAAMEPTLAQECAEWKQEFTEIMAVCGGDVSRMNLALNNTYEKVSDVFSAEEYNKIVGGVLNLYGASLSDRSAAVFDGDYTQLKAADCLRMTYTSTGSMERQAVMANVMNAFYSTSFCQAVYSGHSTPKGYRKNPEKNTKKDVQKNLDALHTISLDRFKGLQQFVSNTHDGPTSREANPNYLRSKRAQVGARSEDGPELFTKDPSPVLDAFRGVIESAASYCGTAGTLEAAEYDGTIKPIPEIATPEFGDDEILGLRAMAFANAKSTLRAVTGDAYDKLKTEVQDPEETVGGKKSQLYEERRIIVRGAYEIRNSVMQEKFDARKKADGVKNTQKVYHGTGFGAACAIMHDGQFRISGVEKASGTTMGPGVYVGRSSGKSVVYAGTAAAYSAEIAELMYDGSEDYSQNDFADGVLFKMRMSKGKKSTKVKSTASAKCANKNSGGTCDVVECTGYKAWEAVVADSDLLCPQYMIDTGVRYASVSKFHYKNVSNLSTYGPNMASKTNMEGSQSLIEAYISKLESRPR